MWDKDDTQEYEGKCISRRRHARASRPAALPLITIQTFDIPQRIAKRRATSSCT